MQLISECRKVVSILIQYGNLSSREAMGRFIRHRGITEPATIRMLWDDLKRHPKHYSRYSTTREATRTPRALDPRIIHDAHLKAREDAEMLGDTLEQMQ